MVHLASLLCVRNRGPHKLWRRRRILSLSAHFWGKRRNCFRIAVRGVNKALMKGTTFRTMNRVRIVENWEYKLGGACEELGTTYPDMHRVLNNAGIALDRKILSGLAVWEPRTFRALASLTKHRVAEERINDPFGPLPPAGVVTRGML